MSRLPLNRQNSRWVLRSLQIVQLVFLTMLVGAGGVAAGVPMTQSIEWQIGVSLTIYSLFVLILRCGFASTLMVTGCFLGLAAPAISSGPIDAIRQLIAGLVWGGAIGLAAGAAVDYLNAPSQRISSPIRDAEEELRSPPIAGDSP
jgi:hypothetical protein